MAGRAVLASVVAVIAMLSVPPKSSMSASGINARALLHDTRSLSYRAPFGAVSAGTSVRLGLRTAHNGASSVSLLLVEKDVNGRALSTSTHKLTRSSQNGRYAHWQVSVKTTQIGAYSYAFQVHRGSAMIWLLGVKT